MCERYFDLVFVSDQRHEIGTELCKFIGISFLRHKVMPSIVKLDLTLSIRILLSKMYFLKPNVIQKCTVNSRSVYLLLHTSILFATEKVPTNKCSMGLRLQL